MTGPLTIQLRTYGHLEPSELVAAMPAALGADQRTGSWVFEAAGKYSRLHLDATDAATRGLIEHEEVFRREVCHPLTEARSLLTASHSWISPRRWWTGCEIEETWRLLHQAEAGLLLSVDDDEVAARSRGVLASSRGILGLKDERVTALEEAIKKSEQSPATAPSSPQDAGLPKPTDAPALRRAVLVVVHGRHQTTDTLHQLARSYRNTILTASLTLFGLAGILLVLQRLAGFELFNAQPETHLGPTELLLFVMFFGCIGAIFSAAPSIATQPKSTSPYAVARQQVIFKVAVGAWSAIVGLLAVTIGLVAPHTGEATTTSTSIFSSAASLAIIAAMFGAAQEAISRFADRKVRDVLDDSSTD
jgi:hypothetical protein